MTGLAEKKAAARENGLRALHPDQAEHVPSEELLLSYIPQTVKPIVEFSRTGILKPGNVLTIVGHIGLGKSQITESIVSSFLNPYVDTLGIKVLTGDTGPILWIDTERTRDDIRIGFDRIQKRIAIAENPDLIDSDRFKNVHCHPFIAYPLIPARVKELERLVLDLTPSMVILDGAADFVRDVNSVEETTDFVALLVALANQHNFGVITSIHPNPGQGQDSKPRGWLGSELLRKSESILLLKRAPDDRDIRILTMDFGHGKNRNAADNLEHYFTWSKEHKMFVSCDYTPQVKTRKGAKQQDVFNEILADGRELGYMELAREIESRGHSLPTAKRWISEAKNKLIFENNGIYKALPF